MRIAVIGAGFAGLAATYYLSLKGFSVTLFDKKGIGAGASGASAGLLHPYPGEHGRLSWHADAAMEATRELLQVAEKQLGRAVASYSGILKKGECIGARDDVEKIAPDTFLIQSGITVFPKLYLEGLWKACASQGATVCQEEITTLPSFDCVVLAVGGEIKKFCQLELGLVKGQMLVCRLPTPLERSITAKKYIAITEDPHLCHIGSTYERGFASSEPCLEKAVQLLEPEYEVLECRAGLRVTNPAHYFPILKKIDAKTWVITALGSRGLLYHAYLGKKLTQEIGSA
jgi:glycine/D-amino acid oxidase-like deaminating enzyme